MSTFPERCAVHATPLNQSPVLDDDLWFAASCCVDTHRDIVKERASPPLESSVS